MNAIYLAFDDAFFPFARACLNSLRHNYPNHPRLLVDYPGRSAAVRDFLGAHAAHILDPTPLPDFASALRTRRNGRDVLLGRFKLWRSAFDTYDTILHLDADMLIMHPLDDLFAQATPFFVANHEPSDGVRVFGEPVGSMASLKARLDEDGLAFPGGVDDMVNAGLFALPRAYRTRKHMALLSRLAHRYGADFAFADQSLLSLWLADIGQKPDLDFRYNFQAPFFTDPSIRIPFEDIRVLHFSSHRKPGTESFKIWRRVSPYQERLEKLFVYYRDLSV